MSKVVVGQVMPDFSFSTDRHSENRLSEVVKKADKTVLWVLRYIGCPPVSMMFIVSQKIMRVFRRKMPRFMW